MMPIAVHRGRSIKRKAHQAKAKYRRRQIAVGDGEAASARLAENERSWRGGGGWWNVRGALNRW
jgi:hypothetical protein